MITPVFDSFEDDWIATEAMWDDEEWMQWEKEAAELELPVDYYVAEFVNLHS